MQLGKSYLKGLVPLIVMLFFSNFSLSEPNFGLHVDWWNCYLVVSYLIVFPLVFRSTRQRFEKSTDIGDERNRPSEHAEQEALKTSSSYANTGRFGVSRIGDSGGDGNWLTRWGMGFIMRLFLIVAGIFVYGYRKLRH